MITSAKPKSIQTVCKYIIAFICGSIISSIINAQFTNYRDSLYKIVQTGKPTLKTIDAYLRYGEIFEQSKPDTAMYYYHKAVALANRNKLPIGRAYASSYILPILNLRGEYVKALELAQDALEIYKKYGTDKDKSTGYINMGSAWQYFSEFNLALENYLYALAHAEKANHLRNLRIIQNNIASIYIEMGQYEKGIDFAKKSFTIADSLQNTYAKASSLFNIGIGYLNLKQYHEAESSFQKIFALGQTSGDTIIIMDGLLGLGNTYEYQHQWREAIKKYTALEIMAVRNDAKEYQMSAYFGMGNVYGSLKEYTNAKNYLKKAIFLAAELGTKKEQADYTLKLAEVEKLSGDFRNAIKTLQLGYLLKDSIFKKNNELSILSITAKYQAEKKEAIIQLQEALLKRRKLLNYLLGACTVSAILIGLLIYYSYRQKRKLDQKRIAELETEKQLAATEAVLKGEAQERARLAKDLHDGLGGMLSGIKYSLNAMKGNLILTPDNAQSFERSIDMLDSSIKEMRRVAHNMMPEILLKFGLEVALKDFCNDINQSGALYVTYESFGMNDIEINQNVSLTIYRIIQELANNIIKHAAATHAIIQLVNEGDTLNITVEDNGKGFDKDLIFQQQTGLGWNNISHRIQLLNGTFVIDTETGKGASVNIKIPLQHGH